MQEQYGRRQLFIFFSPKSPRVKTSNFSTAACLQPGDLEVWATPKRRKSSHSQWILSVLSVLKPESKATSLYQPVGSVVFMVENICVCFCRKQGGWRRRWRLGSESLGFELWLSAYPASGGASDGTCSEVVGKVESCSYLQMVRCLWRRSDLRRV